MQHASDIEQTAAEMRQAPAMQRGTSADPLTISGGGTGLAGMNALWRQLPGGFRAMLSMHLILVGLIAAVATSVSFNGTSAGYQRISFALPAVEHINMPWRSEVDAFGDKVSQAFGVRRNTATDRKSVV